MQPYNPLPVIYMIVMLAAAVLIYLFCVGEFLLLELWYFIQWLVKKCTIHTDQ